MTKPICVLDCSLFMSWFLPDEEKTDFDSERYDFYVPAIFFPESLNALFLSLKRKRVTIDQYNASLAVFQELPFNMDPFSSYPESLPMIGVLCQKYDLTSYDAAYLELALRLKCPLLTLDEKLKFVSQQAGVPVV